MDAWTLDESPGEYRWGSVPDPEPAPGDVRVAVVASALNHMDHWLTVGRPRPRAFPHVPGIDVAGVVEAVGDGVTAWVPGDEVVVNPTVCPLEAVVRHGVDAPAAPGMRLVGEHRWGGHGRFVVVPERNLVARPAGRSWVECAAYPGAYSTAWRMLRRARLAPGETLLVVGIGGGVSQGLLALGRHLGAEVVVTSRDPAKREEALALGATAAFDSADPWDVEAQVVAESVGAATWDRSVRALAPAGRLVVCGATSGAEVALDLPRLWFKQHEVIGSTMASSPEFADLTRVVAAGLPIVVDGVHPLDAFPRALERLRAGEQLGKIVLEH